MFTATQIVAHLVGDYLLQTDWMASEKVRNSRAAAMHAFTYSLPFLFLGPSVAAWCAILAMHFFIDRYRVAKYLVYLKENIGNWRARGPVTSTGYSEDKPPWMAVWLLIVADNTLHLLTNGIALTLLDGVRL